MTSRRRRLVWWLQDWTDPTRRRWKIQRLRWWTPASLESWRSDGWRWRVATLADKLPRQCWADLVDWALRRHEDDPDTPLRDLARRLPIRTRSSYCLRDRDDAGSCYCGKLRTRAFQAELDRAELERRLAR